GGGPAPPAPAAPAASTPLPPRIEAQLAGLPDSPPVWDTRPARPDGIRVAATSYVVRPGDSLGRIAQTTGAGIDAIAAANGITEPNRIQPGQRLRIPGGRYHPIAAGDSGIAIARAYGIAWDRIVAANGLTDPYILRAGRRLLIPEPAGTPGQNLEERAAAFRIDIDSILTGGQPAIAENQAPARPVDNARQALPSTAAVAEPRNFSGRFDWPIDGRVVRRFGPGSALGEKNNGIDLAVAGGSAIRAAADGVVAYVGTGIPSYGGLILIRHGDGWITAYAQAAELSVTRGQAVKRGQTIGRAGAGDARVHFEIRSKRAPVDPLKLLPARS
uniref:M23 family metallopeptidase n=1 Tax=Sphingomonas flavalba TaxID=2559804 RepID=UPI00109D84BA